MIGRQCSAKLENGQRCKRKASKNSPGCSYHPAGIPQNVNPQAPQAPQKFGQAYTVGKEGPLVETGGHIQRDSLIVRILSIFR